MSRSLRTLATATLAIVLGVGLVGQLSLTSPAFATDAASSQGADASSAAGASADASAGSTANAASDAAADGGAGAEASAEADAKASAGGTDSGATDKADASAQANGDDGDEHSGDSSDTDSNGSGSSGADSHDAAAQGSASTGADSDGAGNADGKSDTKQGELSKKTGTKSLATPEDPDAKGNIEAPRMMAGLSGLPSAGFKPGYIISDANMYNGKSLSAAQIQSFLNQQVPRCTIGDAGRKAGSKWGNTTVASHCLRNLTVTTQNRAANAYCGAYTGAKNESAAQIIAKVGVACGINPKVLLVRLQLEQSLVLDTWPTVRQFSFATGWNCPDSGPGNSANCNNGTAGFIDQVYGSAWQLKRYKAHPAEYNYRPNRTNPIQWHPNKGCGTSNVYIENDATAALYIYTPYRPNQAALNAGWNAASNSCSTYGNRNFYQYYRAWFGSPNTFFPDVPESHKFFDEIEWMGEEGLSTGTKVSDSRGVIYEPSSSVTREAMAAFLYRLKGEKGYTAPKVSPFEDMKPGDKFYKEIAWMYERGHSTGNKNPGGKPLFRPKENVSREAMAAFLYRYEKSTYAGMPTSPFADVKKGHKFYKEITWMRKTGLSYGNKQPSGQPTYAAYDPVSREAMAAFIYRMQH